MRRLFAFAFAVSLAGCSESYTPTAANPVPAGAAAELETSEGVVRAATGSYGIDDVPDSCNTALGLNYNVFSFDEINTSTDRDAYRFATQAGQLVRVLVETPAGRLPTPVTCAVRFRVGTWPNTSWPSLLVSDADPSPDRCSFQFTPAVTKDWCVTVQGIDGAYGPENYKIKHF